MFIIFFFARKYYRRHVTDVPREDLVTTETASKGTHTTDTLTRGQDFSYGAMGDDGIRNPMYGNHDGAAISKATAETGTGPMETDSFDSDVDELGQPKPEGMEEKPRTSIIEHDLGDADAVLDTTKITLEIKD
jgi:hypothetical protein